VVYTPLSNYKHDRGPHRLQSGPSHTSDDLNLVEKYLVVSSGYVDPLGNTVAFYGVNNTGGDFGFVTAGPPNSGIYLTDAWRTVPPAMEGFWTDYQNVDFAPSGLLSSYDGYRGLSVVTIANAKVSTAAFPQPGLRTTGKYTYFGGFAPSNQGYDPYNTPGDSSPALGLTGGGVTHGRSEGGILTNPFSTSIGSGTSTRADWVYNPPVYCQTFTESIRATSPAGNMSTVTRYIYRGHASTYVSNYASIYGFAPEGVRGLIRHYSPTVNSSNQKNV